MAENPERTPEEKARVISSALPGSLPCVPPLYPPPDLDLIQGFSTKLTVSPGERIEFKVSTSADSYDVRFYRIGKRTRECDAMSGLKGSRKSLTELPWEGCVWGDGFRVEGARGNTHRILCGGTGGFEGGLLPCTFCRETTPGKETQACRACVHEHLERLQRLGRIFIVLCRTTSRHKPGPSNDLFQTRG